MPLDMARRLVDAVIHLIYTTISDFQAGHALVSRPHPDDSRDIVRDADNTPALDNVSLWQSRYTNSSNILDRRPPLPISLVCVKSTYPLHTQSSPHQVTANKMFIVPSLLLVASALAPLYVTTLECSIRGAVY